MKGVIDADTHIAESEAMWAMIDSDMAARRPVLVKVPDDTLYGPRNAFWLIDGSIFPKPAGKGSFRLITPSASKAEQARGDIHLGCREMTDVRTRLNDMDRFGVHTQIVYPTIFLVYLTEDPALEVALCRAYNRFLAQACEESGGRIRWVAVPPLQSMDQAVAELKWAREHGAVGVFFRGIEGRWTLDNPYLFPVYQTANDLDMPICIHTGAGCPAFIPLFDVERNHSFGHSRIQPLMGFRDLVANRIPEQFPRLRFGFLEASAGWIPFLLHILKRLLKRNWRFSSDAELFHEYRIFIACEADEDVNYIARYTGEDQLVIGSDYGHQDPSEERELVAALRAREDIPHARTEKILSSNPRRLYPLDA